MWMMPVVLQRLRSRRTTADHVEAQVPHQGESSEVSMTKQQPIEKVLAAMKARGLDFEHSPHRSGRINAKCPACGADGFYVELDSGSGWVWPSCRTCRSSIATIAESLSLKVSDLRPEMPRFNPRRQGMWRNSPMYPE
jgi:hypothetical protein